MPPLSAPPGWGQGTTPAVPAPLAAPFPSAPSSLFDPPAGATLPVAAHGGPDAAPGRPGSRMSRAAWGGALAGLCGLVALCWGLYHLLASIRIVSVFLAGAPLINSGDITLIAVGCLVLLVALVACIVGVVRSRPRTVPALFLVALIVVPVPACMYSLAQGVNRLQVNTSEEVRALSSDLVGGVTSRGSELASMDPAELEQALRSLDPAEVSSTLDTLEAFGVDVPEAQRQALLDGLATVREGSSH